SASSPWRRVAGLARAEHPATGIAVANAQPEEAPLGRRLRQTLGHLRRHVVVVVDGARDEGQPQSTGGLVIAEAADDAGRHKGRTASRRLGPPSRTRVRRGIDERSDYVSLTLGRLGPAK